ncbi:MAG: ABC transporter permease [Gemmataceae bacterium]|nr:ABC transporter permease [Gemmataceae bacterium]
MNSIDEVLLRFTSDWRNPVGIAALALVLFVAILYWEQTRFMLKSLRRNVLRSVLTGMATFILVLVITLVWSILAFLDRQTAAKSENLKAIITEKYQLPSQMPISYATSLAEGAPRNAGDYRVNPAKDSMLWAFYGGTLDPNKKTRENIIFFFAMEPSKIISYDNRTKKYSSMMDDIDQATDEEKRLLNDACREMEKYPYKVLVGPTRLAQMNKRVGERFKVTSLNYKEIDLEFEILGEIPGGRYELSAAMNYQYLQDAIESYNKGKSKDKQHAMTERTLALMWVRVPDMDAFERVAQQISSSPEYTTPAVKCDTASSGIASFLDAYKDLLFGMRWLLVPAILVTMSLVIANAISISVRERRVEMAVLKVLGFSPNQILSLVLGEALLIGCTSGLISGWLTYFLINDLVGGLALPIAFFGKFFISDAAPWWGLSIGAATALAGSVLPAWSARSVKVSEVFSKVA